MNSHGERGREGVFINWESFKSSETTVERLLLLFFLVPLFFPELASGPYLSLCWALFYTCDVQGLYKVILKQDASYCGSIM